MPRTNKKKINKKDFVDIIRSVFVTKEDSEYIYEQIHNKVLSSLDDGYVVNLFSCVSLEVKKGNIIRSRVYPTLKNEWKMIQGF